MTAIRQRESVHAGCDYTSIQSRVDRVRQPRNPGLHTTAAHPPSPGIVSHTFTGNTFGGDFFFGHPPPGAAPRPLRELVAVFGTDDLPLMKEVNPYTLGVTASAVGNAHEHGRTDPYVARTRDHVDTRLAAALAEPRLGR
ncbi:hypothetical protein [Nocardia xishanensis]|uniref:Uncharacterized protein n=1 Tax=Nocardia xishanensis TaxID=238964 RepID=A0ABW7XAU1_9NOCA